MSGVGMNAVSSGVTSVAFGLNATAKGDPLFIARVKAALQYILTDEAYAVEFSAQRRKLGLKPWTAADIESERRMLTLTSDEIALLEKYKDQVSDYLPRE